MTIQTVFSELSAVPEFDLKTVIRALTTKSRAILSVEESPIELGNKADLTVFDPAKKWTFSQEEVLIATRNSPVFGKELQGFVCGVINNGKFALKEN